MTCTREKATVSSFTFGIERESLTVIIGLAFDDGGAQSFGGLAFGADHGLAGEFADAVADVFRVDNITEIKGLNCYALRCWDRRSAEIEGIEWEGRRLTLTSFRRRREPTCDSALDRKQKMQRIEINRQLKAIERAVADLYMANHEYLDWERIPVAGEKPRVEVVPFSAEAPRHERHDDGCRINDNAGGSCDCGEADDIRDDGTMTKPGRGAGDK